MLVKSMLVLLALGGAVVVEAAGIPASSCTFVNSGNHALGFNCQINPSDSNNSGNFNGNVDIDFPVGYNPGVDPIGGGYLVLTTGALDVNGQDTNSNNWTQVLWFVENIPTFGANYMHLFSVGCANDGNVTDRSCFPTFATVNGNASFFDISQSVNSAYVYNPCPECTAAHVYTINRFVESSVPEPTTFVIMGGGIAVLAGIRGRRSFRA